MTYNSQMQNDVTRREAKDADDNRQSYDPNAPGRDIRKEERSRKIWLIIIAVIIILAIVFH